MAVAESASTQQDLAAPVQFARSQNTSSFNYTEHLEQVMQRWCLKYPMLQHIDMDLIVVSMVKSRVASGAGVNASVASLRSPGSSRGAEGVLYKKGRAAYYHARFYLPRFQDLFLEEKVSTILYMLYQAHPRFDGRLRRPGSTRSAACGNAALVMNDAFEHLRLDILRQIDPVSDLFLNCRFGALVRRFGDIYGNSYASAWPYEDRVQVVS